MAVFTSQLLSTEHLPGSLQLGLGLNVSYPRSIYYGSDALDTELRAVPDVLRISTLVPGATTQGEKLV